MSALQPVALPFDRPLRPSLADLLWGDLRAAASVVRAFLIAGAGCAALTAFLVVLSEAMKGS